MCLVYQSIYAHAVASEKMNSNRNWDYIKIGA